MRKWAYMGIPHTGGTYSVFKNLREGLLPKGVELRWIGIGAEHARRLADGTFNGELQFGTVVAPEESEDKKKGAALVEFFEKGDYEGVFVNALCGLVSTNFVRYLDSRIPRIMIVHSITVGTYAAAHAVRDYVHATVGVSPRIVGDLMRYKRFDETLTLSIPNPIQVEKFAIPRESRSGDMLRVLFLGRIEDGAKGCFLLPKIISEVQKRGISVLWKIAGDGPDLAELKRRCDGLSSVQFLGRMPHERVTEILARADVYVFPSRYEGFGISLVEAMASGCVPVASLVKGVTDSVVENGKNGYLFPIGDWKKAAEHVVQLARNPAGVRGMSFAARQSVCSRFTVERVAKEYAGLMEKVLADPRPLRPPLDLRKWSYPRGLRAGLRTCLPEFTKQRLRALREHLHI